MKHFLTLIALLTTSLAFGQDGCCALMDYDGDRNVSISDFTIFLSNYGGDEVPQASPDCTLCYTSHVFDADQQGEIGLSDLLVMLSLFGAEDVDSDLIWDSVDQCIDMNSCNFMDVSADECTYPDVFGICGGQCLADIDNDGVCDDVDGCSDTTACNFMNLFSVACTYYDALGICGGTCEFDVDGDLRCDDIDNCTDVESCNYFVPGVCACSYSDSQNGCDDPNDIDGDGICDNLDDCVDVEACNYAAYPTIPCAYDFDVDGICDNHDECIDLQACNYAANPSESCAFIDILGECGGGCDIDDDGDGVCDDEDDCVGVVDDCGVCNGPGPTEVVIEDISFNYDSVYLLEAGEWLVYVTEVDTIFGLLCAPPSCGLVGYQGKEYETVIIGDQCWFAENLRSENFANGDPIPGDMGADDWGSTSEGASSVYGEGECSSWSPAGNACNNQWSLSEFGRLYNWYAVSDSRNLCPVGWHVPTQSDWTELINYLGGAGGAGEDMKAVFGWYESGNGSNSSGFSGLPGGFRGSVDGSFEAAGQSGFWWSSTVWSSTHGEALGLYFGNDDCQTFGVPKNTGLSVRCIQDSE